MVRAHQQGTRDQEMPHADQIEADRTTHAGPEVAAFHAGCADDGVGRPTVLLHCSGADRSHWDRVIAAWTAKDSRPRRFLRPEFFGCGATARWPERWPITLQDYVHLVTAALADIDEPFDLVGHSFGGAVALAVARAMPERLRSLTLIEPSAFFLLREDGPQGDIQFEEAAQLARIVRRGVTTGTDAERRQTMAFFMDYWNGAGRWDRLPPQAQQAMADMADVVAQDIFAVFADRMRLADCRAIAVPSLLVTGGRSPGPVRHIVDRLADVMPAARMICIEDAAHMIPLTHAEVLARLLCGER